MKNNKKIDGLPPIEGRGEKVLSVRVSEQFYALLMAAADEQKMGVSEMVRLYLGFLFFPDTLAAYIANFAESIKDIDTASPEEISKGIKIYEQFCDGVLKAFETAKVAEQIIKESRDVKSRAEFELSKNFAKMMEAWKHSRENVEQIEA